MFEKIKVAKVFVSFSLMITFILQKKKTWCDAQVTLLIMSWDYINIFVSGQMEVGMASNVRGSHTV